MGLIRATLAIWLAYVHGTYMGIVAPLCSATTQNTPCLPHSLPYSSPPTPLPLPPVQCPAVCAECMGRLAIYACGSKAQGSSALLQHCSSTYGSRPGVPQKQPIGLDHECRILSSLIRMYWNSLMPTYVLDRSQFLLQHTCHLASNKNSSLYAPAIYCDCCNLYMVASESLELNIATRGNIRVMQNSQYISLIFSRAAKVNLFLLFFIKQNHQFSPLVSINENYHPMNCQPQTPKLYTMCMIEYFECSQRRKGTRQCSVSYVNDMF